MRDYYEILGVERALRRRGAEVRLPQAGDGAPSRPQRRLRGGRRRGSRKSTRPIRSSPIRRSARPTTASATPASTARAAAGGGFTDVHDIFNEVFGDVFGDMFGARQQRRRSGPARGAGPALRPRDHPRAGLRRRRGRDQGPGRADLRGLQRLRRAARHQPDHLRHLRRRGPRARQPGLLHHRAHLPALRRRRAGWCWIPATTATATARCAASARWRCASRPASTTARASAWPARATPAQRGGPRGDLYIFLSVQAARAVRARRAGPALHGAGADGDRRARRRDRGALPARRRELRRRVQDRGQGARRRPDRPHRAPEGPRHALAALARPRRPGGRAVRRDPDQADRPAEGADARIRRPLRRAAAPAHRHASSARPAASGTGSRREAGPESPSYRSLSRRGDVAPSDRRSRSGPRPSRATPPRAKASPPRRS